MCVSSAPSAIETVMCSVLGVTELLYSPHKPKSKLEEQRPESDEARSTHHRQSLSEAMAWREELWRASKQSVPPYVTREYATK